MSPKIETPSSQLGSPPEGPNSASPEGASRAQPTSSLYKELFDALNEGACVLEVIFDAEGNCSDYIHVEVNAAFEAQTGLVNGVGKRMRQLYPEMEDFWPRLYGGVARSGQPIRQESFFSGLNRWFEVSATRLGGEGSRKVGVVFRDTTARKESEKKAHFLEKLSMALSRAPDESTIVSVATELTGNYLRADRCYFVECFPEEDRVEVGKNWTRENISSVEGSLTLHDFGGLEWWEKYSGGDFSVTDVATHPLTAKQAKNYQAVGIQSYAVQPFRDESKRTTVLGVTLNAPRAWTSGEMELLSDVVARVWPLVERVRAETKLRSTESKLRESAGFMESILAANADCLKVLDLDGHMQWMSEFGMKVMEVCEFSTIAGAYWPDFWKDETTHREVTEALRVAGAGGISRFRGFCVTFAGSPRWWDVIVSPIRGSDGKVSQILSVSRDVSAVKAIEDALQASRADLQRHAESLEVRLEEVRSAKAQSERANQAKDDFLAALSHELRTPLAPVLMATSELKLDQRLPSEVRTQLNMIERNVSLEARLIDDLLDLTKITHGKLQLLTEPSDVHSLVGQAMEIVREDARSKNITIERGFHASKSELSVDPIRFQQVIWNLLRNSVKFTPKGGTIRIVTSERFDSTGIAWLRLEVSDSGIGIDAERLESIFKPFDQGVLVGSHRFGGLGLGLAIARAIVDLHGGSISATSGGLGKGATFTVELPGASAPRSGIARATAFSNPNAPLEAEPISPLKLLLVEDHEATLRTMILLLERDGHSIVPCSSVAEALEVCKTAKFDFVISDLGLPDGSGIELMERLRDKYQLRGIALSGYGMEEDLERSRSAGFVTHLIKPVLFADLKRALRRAASL